MAESTASIGGYMASGYRRVAGVQLSINHLKPARIGDRIETKANPIQVGRNVQVRTILTRNEIPLVPPFGCCSCAVLLLLLPPVTL